MSEDRIWVLSCGDIPHVWHEDVYVLLRHMQDTLPDNLWEKKNPVLWEMKGGPWKLTAIDRLILPD